MPRRRRKPRRHRLDPLRYLTPENLKIAWSIGWKLVLAGGATTGAIAGQQATGQVVEARAQADTARTQTGYANANTNAALACVALLTDRLNMLEGRIARLERASPAAMIGPAVPATWIPQPVKKPGWFDRHFRGG